MTRNLDKLTRERIDELLTNPAAFEADIAEVFNDYALRRKPPADFEVATLLGRLCDYVVATNIRLHELETTVLRLQQQVASKEQTDD